MPREELVEGQAKLNSCVAKILRLIADISHIPIVEVQFRVGDDVTKVIGDLLNGSSDEDEDEDDEDDEEIHAQLGVSESEEIDERDKYELLMFQLRVNYDAIVGNKPDWEKFRKSLTPDVLVKLKNYKEPELFEFNVSGEAVFSDRDDDGFDVTCGITYTQARYRCKSVGVSMATEVELDKFVPNLDGRVTWVECGENPSKEGVPGWCKRHAFSKPRTDNDQLLDPFTSYPGCGVQTVLRVKIAS